MVVVGITDAFFADHDRAKYCIFLKWDRRPASGRGGLIPYDPENPDKKSSSGILRASNSAMKKLLDSATRNGRKESQTWPRAVYLFRFMLKNRRDLAKKVEVRTQVFPWDPAPVEPTN